MKRGVLFGVFCLIVLFGLVSAEGGFVESVVMKVSVREGESVGRELKVISDSNGEYDLFVVGGSGVSVGESGLILEAGRERATEAVFDSRDLLPGVSVGSFVLEGQGESHVLPIIFEVESEDVFYDVSLDVPASSGVVGAGESFEFGVSVFDLLDVGESVDVGLVYEIFSLGGEGVFREEEEVGISGQSAFSKEIVMPRGLEDGQYVLTTRIDYGSSTGVSSYLISVGEREGEGWFGKYRLIIV